MVKIAIIDIVGLTYDGNTLNDRGLGGSESAVILMAKELVKVGFSVTVFNNCIDRLSKEGVFDGVEYVDHTKLDQPNNYTFDVVISSRTVIPFLPPQLWNQFADLKPQRYQQIKANAKHKVVWMHDTFCRGDHLMEDMIVHGDIDEIFTLSDFHTAYVTNCDHGKKRMFEVMRDKVFMTRNGIVKYDTSSSIATKDPHQYVYNASVTKGMMPLVTKIWPRIKQQIPQAKLKVIGGYYRFRENAEPDAQEKDWRELVANPLYQQLDVEFTGIIKQSEIAEILSKSSFMLFPGAFPETFGISTLESLAYNTPLITTRFGALGETAVNQACYLIDYPIEPNNLFPTVNAEDQENKFIDAVLRSNADRYLHQQKMYYCNIIDDICTWDTIALQWKQHLFTKLKEFLPIDDYRRVSKINSRVHQVFGRRFSNPEENYIPRNPQQRVVVISPVYNAELYIEKCIQSVQSQDYDNWKMYIIDDCSTDNTYKVASEYESDFIQIIRNGDNRGAVRNQIKTILANCQPNDIIMLLDGDDWLVPNNQIFHFYNNLYDGTTEFTYGSCWSLADNIPLIAQPYPESVKRTKTYRQHLFNWNIPYTHLRTFKAYLLEGLDESLFQDENGKWFKAGGDGSVFYALIEQANPSKIKVVQDIVYVYNDKNPLNDYKINSDEQTKNANKIIGKKDTVKKILIAVPSAKNIEARTFKSIYDLIVPEGYETELQFFFGYQVDQVRNLIAHWAVNYDYLFAVDSDMGFAPDTLLKLLSHNVDVVSGLYIQRKEDQHTLEIYDNYNRNVPYENIKEFPLVEVGGCGFGCVLVKSEVLRAVGYPQFVYKSAIDHKDTISEDVYFCAKARERGFKIYADTTILCDHIGATTFKVGAQFNKPTIQTELDRLRELSRGTPIPNPHYQYLLSLQNQGVNPKVVFDVGACVLHWTNLAKRFWPNAQYYAFEAMQQSATIFEENNIEYQIGLLSDQDGKDVVFYQNTRDPGGNSYYKENSEINKQADVYFNDSHKIIKKSMTIDSIVERRNFPQPDLIKMDVQGAELDVLKGSLKTLEHCQDLILELQKVEYNKGAPLCDEVIAYVESLGFKMKSGPFCDNGPDGDYHFSRN